MDDIARLKSYADLKRHVSPSAFTAAMNFLAWHNRLKMTAMLPVPQALIVALMAEQRPLDPMVYQGIKGFLFENVKDPPESIDDCRRLAGELVAYLKG